jgi:hypothetical protein
MSDDPGKSFLDRLRSSAAGAAPTSGTALPGTACDAATPREQLGAFRERIHYLLTRELKLAEVEWTEQRNLKFAVEDRYFQFFFDEHEPCYISMYGGLLGRFTDEGGRVRALEAASTTTRDVKAAKVFLFQHGDAWFAAASIELVVPALDAVDKLFVKRMLGLLRHGITDFAKRFAELGGS